MNFTIRSFTPRILVTEPYNSLQNDQGCQALIAHTIASFFAPVQICIKTNLQDPAFRTEDTQAFAYGPAALYTPGPMKTLWQAFVGSGGVRLTTDTTLQPLGSTSGVVSGLFSDDIPIIVPTRISFALDSNGSPWIAFITSASDQTVEVRWFAGGVKQSATFTGYYPTLFFSGLVYETDGGLLPEVGCYYISRDDPSVLCLRLSSESFGDAPTPTGGETGHIVDGALPFPMQDLIEARPFGDKIKIYGTDSRGRQVVITTVDIPFQVIDDMNIGVGLTAIKTLYCVVDAGETDETMNLSIGFKSAKLNKTLMDAGTIPDKVKVSIGVNTIHCYLA